MIVELFDGTDARFQECIDVRVAVFVVEQGVPMDEELDEHDTAGDPTAVHALVRDGNLPVAAGRSYVVGSGVVRIGRMAVLEDVRGRGVGRAMLEALMQAARERGFHRAVLAAQVHAQAFYEKAGFAVAGPTFMECDIPHVEMARAL